MIKFEQGKQITHTLTGKKLWMLKEGREQILCRTEDLREIWFYPEELGEATMSESVTGRRSSDRFL